jgi:hypothetical protein
MNPKNHMHTQRCFGMAISMKAQWRGLWLELFFLAFTLLLIVLVMQNSRGEAHAPKKSCTCHPRFPTHFAGHHVLISPGWRTPCLGNIACYSDIFSENSRRQKIKYNRIELFTT